MVFAQVSTVEGFSYPKTEGSIGILKTKKKINTVTNMFTNFICSSHEIFFFLLEFNTYDHCLLFFYSIRLGQ